MLKLAANPTFDAEVKITVPGQVDPEPVTMTFKYLPKSEIEKFTASVSAKSDPDAVSEILLGWQGIDQPFTPENVALLLENFPASAGEIMRVFYRELLESRAKN